jgi:glycosyltransferase involved in cell wall biosynthesis
LSTSDLTTARDQLAGAFGRLIHVLAATARRVARRSSAAEATGPVRVAVLCDAFIRYGSEQALGLKASGADVTFYFIDRLGEFDGNEADRRLFLDRVHEAGIPVIALPQRNLRRMWLHVTSLHRDLRRRGIEALVVHSHIDPRYATLGLRFPVALFIHDPRPHSGDYASTYPLPVRAMARIAELTASCLIIHSERLKPQMWPLMRGVPTGVVLPGAKVEDAPRLPKTPVSVAVIGRLMEYKGVDTALAAFRRVREQRPDCTMVVAGNGRMGDEIRAASPPGVDLRDRYIPESELESIFDSSRLILLPYKDATQSGVGLMAVARGVPCIVSDVGALPDLVPPGREWVVPAGNPEALAESILAALDHNDQTRWDVLSFARQQLDWPVAGARLLSEMSRLGVLRSEAG